MATPIAGIIEIAENSSFKFTQHNEGLRHLEALSIGAVLDTEVLDPTSLTPAEGDLYLINGTGAGIWLGFDDYLPIYESAAWKFYAPFEGLTVFSKASKSTWCFLGGKWLNISGFTEDTITLPYTLTPSDRNKELIVASGTGNFNIPDLAGNPEGFEDYWECLLTLDGTGDITVQRAAGNTTNLITESGNQQLKTQGRTVKIRHRTGDIWKVDGALEA